MLLLGIHKIMLATAHEGGAPEYILSVIRFVDSLFSSSMHMRAALEILSIILEDHTEIDYTVHHALAWHEGVASVFRHTVVELLYRPGGEGEETPEDHDALKTSALKLIQTSAVHADPNVGLFLLSFDVKKREYTGVRTVLHALLDNASSIPTSFMTLLTLLTDPRLSHATLRVLRYSRFFQSYLRETGHLQQLNFESLSFLLKCLAIELKTEEGLNTASELVGQSFGRLEECLNMIQLENSPVELPNLEFFDGNLVLEALGQCEYVNSELKTRLVRVEKLDGMLKDEIGKLEKSTVLRLRKTVHSEAKEILEFARNLNQSRIKEGCKLLLFDGWRQVVEVLALTPQLQATEFCPNVLRMLLSKVLGTKGLTEYFLRLAAETTLTLSAVMAGQEQLGIIQAAGSKGTALSVVIHHLCQWIQSATNPNVRGVLYASLLYCVNLLQNCSQETLMASQTAFPSILHNVCKDCCQGVGERTRMQALYLMGEIIKCTTQRGLGGGFGFGSGRGQEWDLDETGGDQSIMERKMENMLDTTVDSVCSFEGSFVEGVFDKSGLNSTQAFFGKSARNARAARSMTPDRGGPSDNVMSPSGSTSSLSWLMKPSGTNFRATNVDSEGKGQGGSGIKRLSGGDERSAGHVSRTSIHDTIMCCVYTNGFLSTLVEALCVVDDIDLIALLTSETQDVSSLLAMRAFFVFEAKLTMLSRLAGVGMKTVMYLLDLNLIKRLTDMKVFELQSYHQNDNMSSLVRSNQSARDRASGNDEFLRRNWAEDLGFPIATSTPRDPANRVDEGAGTSSRVQLAPRSSDIDQAFSPGHHTISESLYMQVFKLFHVMLDSAPKNVQVIDQIFQFLRVHDSAVSKLLSPARITIRDTPRHASIMLTSLMSKLAGNQQRIRSMIPVFMPRAMLKPALLNVLRIQAERNLQRGDAVATTLVKHALLFLYYCSKVDPGEDAGGSSLLGMASSQKKVRRQPTISYPVLTNRFEMDTVLREQDENVSLGVVLHCVVNAAQNIIDSQVKERKQNPMITAATSSGSSQLGGMAPSAAATFLTLKMMEDSQSIIEVGLTLIYFHVQFFMQEYLDESQLKKGNRLSTYQETVAQAVEGHLTKPVTEACKVCEILLILAC